MERVNVVAKTWNLEGGHQVQKPREELTGSSCRGAAGRYHFGGRCPVRGNSSMRSLMNPTQVTGADGEAGCRCF